MDAAAWRCLPTSALTCSTALGLDAACAPAACCRQQKHRVSALEKVECTALLRLCAALVVEGRCLAIKGLNGRHMEPWCREGQSRTCTSEHQALLCRACHLTKGRQDLQHLLYELQQQT